MKVAHNRYNGFILVEWNQGPLKMNEIESFFLVFRWKWKDITTLNEPKLTTCAESNKFCLFVAIVIVTLLISCKLNCNNHCIHHWQLHFVQIQKCPWFISPCIQSGMYLYIVLGQYFNMCRFLWHIFPSTTLKATCRNEFTFVKNFEYWWNRDFGFRDLWKFKGSYNVNVTPLDSDAWKSTQ